MTADLRAQGRLAMAWRRTPRRGLRIIAHRGFRACFPENTRSAFMASLGRSHMVELDVRLSRDNEVVIYHDDHLERCSNAVEIGPGLGLDTCRVDQWRLDQLRHLDLGSWFSPYSHEGQTVLVGAGPMSSYLPSSRESIPTLTETLAWARLYRMPLNIELKDQGDPVRNSLLVGRVIQRVVAADCTALALLSSFNYDMLRQCRSHAPFISRAILYGGEAPTNLLKLLTSIDACACHPDHSRLDAGLVQSLVQNGYAVHAWTVNDCERWRYLAGCGVTGIITDYPSLKAVC